MRQKYTEGSWNFEPEQGDSLDLENHPKPPVFMLLEPQLDQVNQKIRPDYMVM